MRNLTCLVAIQTLLLAACTTTGVNETQSLGRIVSTVGKPVPNGAHPAYVYEIDGQRVSHHKPVHRLVPGSHTIRVSPVASDRRSHRHFLEDGTRLSIFGAISVNV